MFSSSYQSWSLIGFPIGKEKEKTAKPMTNLFCVKENRKQFVGAGCAVTLLSSSSAVHAVVSFRIHNFD